MSALEQAKQLKQRGLNIVPLLPREKKNYDKDIDTKIYQLSEVNENGNLGISLHLNNLTVADPETKHAIYFAEHYLAPYKTMRSFREYKNGNKKTVGYFFKNELGLKEDLKLDGKIMEFRVRGQQVVYGTTITKDTDEEVKRSFDNVEPIDLTDQVLNKVKKVAFLGYMAEVVKSANTGALMLDSCIKRYTDYTDSEREDLLWVLFSKILPHDRDTKHTKFKRIVRNNNKETKNAGFRAFAKYLSVSPLKLKEVFNWIGKVPEKDDEENKNVTNFLDNALNIEYLMKEEIPPLKFAIPKILPEGLVCIAGRPKAMKSWTALLIAYSVQNGLELWGHQCEQGDALYLGLEDSKRRMKSRLQMLKFDKIDAPTINLEAPYLNNGLEESIQNWINSVTKPKLVVIDTLARVKPKTKRTSGTVYDLDNELLRKIQKLGMDNGITIAFITHLSKAPQDYSFDRITGSTGLQGMTDAMWLLDRGDNQPNASLIGRGRDIEDFEYSLEWDSENWRYKYKGIKWEIELSENRKAIYDQMKNLLSEGKEEVTPKDVYSRMGFKTTNKEAKNISKTMERMVKDFTIKSGKTYGTYSLNEVGSDEEDIC
jgi:RecA-family ATPase